eukprot:CAMPEP_0202703668 /NCGR_PEP_ID=MMETSP1385-20130828/16485_1 /ASSEMBLY_ACC=CAM_ASM_000861 /TAXON_ID=933848 /ORGANISM="Elphidium margaritaceum" /LENGTH=428 /DNA_ID=CAMNT_0049361559 /DNA_START=19 /DNA_END=1302 /DNA_ORIENTATION=-
MLTILLIIVDIASGFQMVSRVGLTQSYEHLHVESVSYPNNNLDANMTFNVLSFGAVGDGTTDNTKAFQSALQSAADNGGGIVFAPGGNYVFDGQLSIPSGVALFGSYLTVPSHAGSAQPTDGTVLMPYYGRTQQNESLSFITVTTDASIKGVVIFYPEQPCTSNIPVAYPPSIRLNGNNAAVQDVELLNSYIGIFAAPAPRHYIARVQGQPIRIGVFVDEVYDIGRIEDVHFNPWFCNDINYMYEQTMFGRSFVFGRSDWEYVLNTFSFGYAIGYHFIETPTGSMNGNFVGIGADYACNASIVVDQSQPAGLLITNGEFTAFHTKDFAPNSTAISAQLIVNDANVGPVVFSASSFWGPSNNIARLYGKGTVTFSASQFVEWNLQTPDSDAAAIYAENGNIILNANTFQKNGTQIEATGGVKKIIFTNN